MLNNTSFNRSIDLLSRNMSASTLRWQVILNNLANAETPDFKRSQVGFEAELNRVLSKESGDKSIGVTTHEKHIPFDRMADYRSVEPRITLDYLTTAKNNGNNVDVERELNDGVQTQMMYELMTYTMGHQFRMINIVLA